jgi:hypothetical protein
MVVAGDAFAFASPVQGVFWLQLLQQLVGESKIARGGIDAVAGAPGSPLAVGRFGVFVQATAWLNGAEGFRADLGRGRWRRDGRQRLQGEVGTKQHKGIVHNWW